jgi:hypothetical protein
MHTSLRLLLGGAALVACAFVDFASAQPLPPQPRAGPVATPSPPSPRGPAYNLQQLPETRGTIQRFTLTPRGDLDGFLLADGTQVHLPPHLTTELATAVRLGDPVSVGGYRFTSVPLVIAAAVTDLATNQTVVDRGPPPPGSRPPPPPPGMPAPGAQQTSFNGKVERPLYGPKGDLNGAVLEDGTNIRLAPPVASQSVGLLAPGQTIAVQGWALSTAYGRVVDAQIVGPAPAEMTPVARPQPPSGPVAPPAPPIGAASPPQPPGR